MRRFYSQIHIDFLSAKTRERNANPEHGNRRTWEPQNMGTAEHGNRRTDEQGTLNFEVPEQYI